VTFADHPPQARIEGAKVAKHPIILFLDSHAEVADGWLEPLVARIHEDKTRVVIPNIRGFDLDTLELNPGDPWHVTSRFHRHWLEPFTRWALYRAPGVTPHAACFSI
jgi:polypeptide N-acetylgalactosaminyltransferase